MNAERDISLDEKRVYAGGSSQSAFVASEAGLARVSVSDALVGEFGLTVRDAASDAVADDGRVAVATETDALVATEDGFVETGFGSADAVGFTDGLIACGEGRVARYDDGTWIELGEIDGVQAIAGDLLAADGGVYRPDGTHVGLDDARDVALGSSVFAATGDGLYALANGWMQRLEGDVRAVATNAGRPVAVADDGTLYERRDGEWTAVGAPGDVADAVPTANALYAVTTDGTFLSNAGDGWRDRTLGLQGCRRLAVVDGDS